MTNDIIKFFSNLLNFMAILLIICLILILSRPISKDNFLHVFDFKKQLITESCSANKMVFLGGSNLQYGFDSAQIEEAMNYKVLNLGVTRKTGLKALFNLTKKCMISGDIMIIIPEYENFSSGYYGSPSAEMLNRIEIDPFVIQYFFSIHQLKILFLSIPEFLRLKIESFYSNKYLNNSVMQYFTYNGDFLYSKYYSPNEISQNDTPLIGINENSILDMKNEILDLNSKNVDIYIIYPPIPGGIYQEYSEEIEKLDKYLTSQKIKILGKPKDFVFDESSFFDTIYHLKYETTNARTSKIIQLLLDNNISNKSGSTPK